MFVIPAFRTALRLSVAHELLYTDSSVLMYLTVAVATFWTYVNKRLSLLNRSKYAIKNTRVIQQALV